MRQFLLKSRNLLLITILKISLPQLNWYIVKNSYCQLKDAVNQKSEKKDLSEVGFEPTPSHEDQNALPRSGDKVIFESGVLDRSAILTC